MPTPEQNRHAKIEARVVCYGTAYFVSIDAAERYYSPYGFNRDYVDRSVADGSIHIGRPPLKLGETLSLIDDGTRYAITAAC